VQAQDAASLINVILYGAQPSAELPPTALAWEDMGSFRDKLSDTEVSQLANYLRGSWKNRGDRVPASAVASQR